MQEACVRYGVEFDAKESKEMLWDRLKRYVEANIQPVIVNMVRETGHDILFTPPHYSDLHPIETVWAIVKGEVGRRTTFSQVLTRLNASFNKLSPNTVAGCILKANKTLDALHKHIWDVDHLDDDSSTSGDESTDSSSSGTLSEDEMSV